MAAATIPEWDPYSVLGVPGKHPSVVVVAARNSGKTVTLRAILEPLMARPVARGGYAAVFVLSRCAPTLDAYAEWVPIEGPGGRARPEPFVDLTTPAGAAFLPALIAALAKAPARVLVILDDFLETGRTRYDTALSELYTQGRHLGVTVVSVTQSLSELSTSTRKNATVVMCGQLTSGVEQRAFTEQFLSFCMPADPAEWPAIPFRPAGAPLPQKEKLYLRALFRALTTRNRYGFVVVDFDKPATFSDSVAFFKAPAPSAGGQK